MTIIYCDMDAFFCSVEQKTRPSLAQKIVAVAGLNGRGVIVSPSYQARKYGVRAAMPVFQAKELLPINAVLIPPRHELYAVTARAIWNAVKKSAQVFEQISIDEACFTINDAELQTEESIYRWCANLQDTIFSRWGMHMSIGFSTSKNYAKIACEQAKPAGIYSLYSHRQVCDFLSSQPVRRIPSIGPVMEKALQERNIYTVADIKNCDERLLTKILGRTLGFKIRQLALGVDKTMPQAQRLHKNISSEKTFVTDVVTTAAVHSHIYELIDKACERLSNKHSFARSMSIYCKIATGQTHVRTTVLLPSYTKDSLLEYAIAQAPSPEQLGPIRLLGIRFQGLGQYDQLSLFDDSAVESRQRSYVIPAPYPTSSTLTDESSSRHAWKLGDDVLHPDFGFGWVQGANAHKVTIRFETASSPQSVLHTFNCNDSSITPAHSTLSWGDINISSSSENETHSKV